MNNDSLLTAWIKACTQSNNHYKDTITPIGQGVRNCPPQNKCPLHHQGNCHSSRCILRYPTEEDLTHLQ